MAKGEKVEDVMSTMTHETRHHGPKQKTLHLEGSSLSLIIIDEAEKAGGDSALASFLSNRGIKRKNGREGEQTLVAG